MMLALLALLGAQRAAASPSQTTTFDATAELLGAPSEKALSQTLNRIAAFGTDSVRIVVPWRFLAPSPGSSTVPGGFNPANPREYDQNAWAGLDAAVTGIRARGMRPLLTPSSPFPNWASRSGKSKLSDPKPSAFKDFVTAMARRYSGDFRVDPGKICPPGTVPPILSLLYPYNEVCQSRDPSPVLPRVTSWAMWNEPNQSLFLKPQRKRGRPYSPKIYRQLFLAGQRGLVDAKHARDQIFIGETAPSGGRDGVNPIDFMKGVFCLSGRYKRNRGCKPIKASGWAHHPYSPGVPPFRRSSYSGLVNVSNISALAIALKRAAGTGATRGKLNIYVTEFGVQTVPDRRFGVGLGRQAGYLAIAEFLMWSNPSIKMYSQYLLRDDSLKQASPFTTGLLTFRGKAKPAFKAFPMTLLVRKVGRKRVKIWGHVRPGKGRQTVTVSFRQRGKTRKLRKLRTNANGYFSFGGAYARGRTWSATSTVRGGRTVRGPSLPAYSF